MIPTMTPRLAPEAACGSDSIGFTDVLVDSLTLLGLVVSATKEGSVALLVGIPVIGGIVAAVGSWGSVAVEVGGMVAGSAAWEVFTGV